MIFTCNKFKNSNGMVGCGAAVVEAPDPVEAAKILTSALWMDQVARRVTGETPENIKSEDMIPLMPWENCRIINHGDY